jgi:hypothetical protein
MRRAAVGLIAVAGLAMLVMIATQAGRDVQAQIGPAQPAAGRGGDVIPIAWYTDERSMVAIVDPEQRVMSVYEVDRDSGAISLRSVRNFTWDLRLEEFNSKPPSPREIRAMVERR